MNNSALNITLKTRRLGRLRRSSALVVVVALSLTAAGNRHQYSPEKRLPMQMRQLSSSSGRDLSSPSTGRRSPPTERSLWCTH